MDSNSIKFKTGLFFLFLLCGMQATAQHPTHFHMRSSVYRMYDPGVYSLLDFSKTTNRGVGLGITKKVHPRVGLVMQGDYSVLDHRWYGSERIRNASHFRLGFNIHLAFIQSRYWESGIQLGYAYNQIPQLEHLGLSPSAMNVNIGLGNIVSITPQWGIDYQLEYNFSLNENLPFAFCQHLGVVYTLGAQDKKQNGAVYSNTVNDVPIQRSVSVKPDTVFIRDTVYVTEAELPTGDINVPAAVEIERYTFMRKDGSVIRAKNPQMKGYYVAKTGMRKISDGQEALASYPFSSLKTVHFVNKGDEFFVLGFLSLNRKEAAKRMEEFRSTDKTLQLFTF